MNKKILRVMSDTIKLVLLRFKMKMKLSTILIFGFLLVLNFNLRASEKPEIFVQMGHTGVVLVQFLPNPYRKGNYFQGGVVYEIPSGPDRFELEVTPPFGDEEIIVYASTEKLGDINLEEVGGVYFVKSSTKEIGEKTRGIKIISKKIPRLGNL